VPNLTSEYAGGQQVVGGLVLLIIEHTDRFLLKAVTLAVLSCPRTSMEGKPEEEFDLGWYY
jgi:hypothetical protein